MTHGCSTLFGRDTERWRLDELLDRARAGDSAAVVIRGEPGIGKSALLDYARAEARDMIVLSARGVEAEAELAFTTLHELLRPALSLVDTLPAPQAAALSAALALGPPAPADRFAVGAATLSLLAAVAEERPLLALVDDAHWADPSSREAVLFAVRRLRADGVVLLLAVREGEGAAIGVRGVDEMRLRPLTRGECAQLVGHLRGVDADAPVADRLCAETGGNPLALIEVAGRLTDAQLVGRDPLPRTLPAVDVETAFLARVAKLPEGARRWLVVAASAETGALDEIEAAARRLELGPREVDAAEAAGLVRVDAGRLSFAHPLLRSAVYHAAPPEDRRAVHRALAETLAEAEESERGAWHLAAAATAPEDEVAAALDRAGEAARRRGDHAAAAAALERAARLTPIGGDRLARLVSAAGAAQLAGRFDASAGLLDEALPGLPADRRPDAVRLGAAVDLWRGRAHDARQLLLAEAARIERDDPAHAAAMLVDAAVPAVMALEIEGALETALQARAVAARDGEDIQAVAAAVAGACLVARGRVREAKPLLERARPLIEQTDPAGAAPPMIRAFVWHLYIVLEWYADAGRLYDAAIHGARAASMPALLPFPLAFRAELRYRTGSWHGAYSDAAESADLAEQTGQWTQLPHSLAVLARIEAGRGDEDSCRAHCARALALAREHGSDAIRVYTAAALGLLELGRGRNTEAVAELEPAVRLVDERRGSLAAVPVYRKLGLRSRTELVRLVATHHDGS